MTGLLSDQLAGNPLHCTCSLSWLVLLHFYPLASSPGLVERVRCKEPKQLWSQDILEVDFSYCDGEKDRQGKGGALGATVIFAVLVVVMVVTMMLMIVVRR